MFSQYCATSHIQGPAQITPLFYYPIFHYKIKSMQFYNITISHSSSPLWHFRWNVPIKTVNYYTHIITLPTTLKQVLLPRDSVESTGTSEGL